MGAALVAAWAGGTGIAQATGDPEVPSLPTCTDDTVSTLTEDGEACEAPPVDPCDLPVLLTGGGYDDGGEEPLPCEPETPAVTVTVVVTGDCADPEAFTFYVQASGLSTEEDYVVLVGSDDVTTPEGDPGTFAFPIEPDADGTVDTSFEEVEGDFQAPTTGFTVDYALATGDEYEFEVLAEGSYDVEPCPVEQPVTPAPEHPATPTAPAAPVVHPVVTPVAAHPAVLANTGSPVTTAALLGGGLLVAGAGALAATRRKAS